MRRIHGFVKFFGKETSIDFLFLSMDGTDIIEYIRILIPLAFAHAAIPPVKYWLGELPPPPLQPVFRAIYSLMPRDVFNLQFVESLALDESNRYGGFHHTMLTSIFVHYDFNHLLTNLSGLFWTGLRVFRRSGPVALYAVFLSGGVVSSLPFRSYYESGLSALEKWSNPQAAKPPELDSLLSLLPSVKDIHTTVSSAISSIINIKTAHMGSSGALSALMGFETGCITRDIACMTLDLIGPNYSSYSTIRSGIITRSPNHLSADQKKHLVLKICIDALTLYAYYGSMMAEWSQIKDSSASHGSLFTFMKAHNTQVGHEAHLQGFAYGALISLAFSFI